MLPQRGLVVDAFAGRKASEDEVRLAGWASGQGLLVLCSSYYEDDGTRVDTTDLGIEAIVGNKIVAYMASMPARRSVWPEALDHMEKLVRAGLDREIEKHCAYKWWEHVT